MTLGLATGLGRGAHAGELPTAPRTVTFTGMCDASGAVPLSATRFAVADDEDNVLRVYDVDRGGAPLAAVDLSKELGLAEKINKKGRSVPPPEIDIEAATLLGERAFWIGSHGRNSKGKLKPERMRFFATSTGADGQALRVVGRSERFLQDLLGAPQLARFDLARASELAPKAEGGLNIEGLTAMFDGRLLIGFRNPVPQGRALLVPLDNPHEVIAGQPARFGEPVLLNLNGLGVRSLSSWRGSYLIAAGHYDSGAASQLFVWDGKHAPQSLPIRFFDFNPEGFFSHPQRGQVMLLSDDGGVAIDGKECKALKDAARKRFRGQWISLP